MERLHTGRASGIRKFEPCHPANQSGLSIFLAELRFGDRVLTDPAQRAVVAWLVGQRLADAVDDIVSLGLWEREQFRF